MSDVQGITFLVFMEDRVLLERCPKKRAVLGVGEWFIPGGKLEPGEDEREALEREIMEELGLTVIIAEALPIIEGSRIPPGPRGLFLMRPYLVHRYSGVVPNRTIDEGVPLLWFDVHDALRSPVPQVRMMVAAAWRERW